MNDDEYSLKRADAPFLNRFEKHKIEFNLEDNEDIKNVFNHIVEYWIDKLLEQNMKENKINLLRNTTIFPNFSRMNLGLII